jgi:hypothetical protein
MTTLARFKHSSDPIINSLQDQLRIDFQSKIQHNLDWLKKSNVFDNQLDTTKISEILEDTKSCKGKRITEFLRKQCISLWLTTSTGISAGSQILHQSTVVKSAIEYAPQLTNSQFHAALQMRSGCVNLRTRPHIRRQAHDINCRLCHGAMESIGHVLGDCPETHGLVVKRHDCVVDRIYKMLSTQSNCLVLKEPSYHINGRTLKPDLVYFNKTSSRIAVIDPTVRVEKDMETRENQIMEKIQKYEPLRHHLSQEYGIAEESIFICPLWIGARGTILKTDIAKIKKCIGLIDMKIIHEISTSTLAWSASIYNAVIQHK